MKTYKIDGSAFKSKKEFYTYIGDVFSFPPYVGSNLDALWDFLRDKSEEEIIIEKARYIPIHLNEYGLAILDVFGDLDGMDGMEVIVKW